MVLFPLHSYVSTLDVCHDLCLFDAGLRCQDQQSACGDKQCDVHVLPPSDLHRISAGYQYSLSLPEADNEQTVNTHCLL